MLRIADYPNPVFNEMWFLTIDPFVGISVFIAKLSERQYCWRVIEDFHSQEYIQFFALATLSPLETEPQILERWDYADERRILVSNFGVTCNSFREFHTLDWFLHV